MLGDLLRAFVQLGLPVAALSWLLFYRLYHRGELARDADHKSIRSSLKQIKKATKASRAASDSLLHAKWMRFGGGFYGVAALWTLIVIEASGILGVIVHPSSIEDMFRDGVVGFVVGVVANQLAQFLQAILWFNWWPARGHDVLVWFVAAYVGYLAGLNLARLETPPASRLVSLDWRARLRARFRPDDADRE